MDDTTELNKNYIMIESRGQKLVTCPHCWTDQRTERDFCYCCGAVFLYRDEQIKKNGNGPARREQADEKSIAPRGTHPGAAHDIFRCKSFPSGDKRGCLKKK